MVHRDVKGQNILFHRDGNVKIVDFGIAASLKEHNVRSVDGLLFLFTSILFDKKKYY